MKLTTKLSAGIAALALAALPAMASAQTQEVKVAVIAPFSGP